MLLYLNSFFDPHPYGLLNKVVQTIHPSVYWNDLFTYYYNLTYIRSSAIVAATSGISLITLPFFLPYLGYRFENTYFYDDQHAHRKALQLALWAPLAILSLELFLGWTGLIILHPPSNHSH